MYRVAVIQNQSESLRAGYADVARNLGHQLNLAGYEFVPIDGANINLLFESASTLDLAGFDALFVSTNATSDEKTRLALVKNIDRIEQFLCSGKGIYFGYQKKMSVGSEHAEEVDSILPDPYRILMRNRPDSEPDSSVGTITITNRPRHSVGGFLLLNSPQEVTEELLMTHCRENDFKSHVYRAVLEPGNESAYETVLEDRSYGTPRRLMLANRSTITNERVVVSTIAIDWENHFRLLENTIRYITEGIPRVALIARDKVSDQGFKFIQSTAKLLRVPHRQYSVLDVPQEFTQIHDVFVVSSRWSQEEVESFWQKISGSKTKSIQPASSFRRLYHMGDPSRGYTSLTRFVNYTTIDVVVNDALLWIERRFQGGFWEKGFWNTHDVLVMMVGLDLDVSTYISSVLRDIEPHLRPGGYDAVMGPSCGLLNLLNRLSIKYQAQLDESGFTIERRSIIASWILNNLEGQSNVARQVAARALFGKGGEAVLCELENNGMGESINALRGIVGKGLNVSSESVHYLSEMELVLLIQLTHSLPALESVLTFSIEELKRRQNQSGLWGSVGRTANILTSILEIESYPPSMKNDPDWDETVSRAVEALRGNYSYELSSWGGIIQDTAMSIHALGLYRSRYDVESQELFETVEADTRSTERSPNVGRARIDLGELFSRELQHENNIQKLRTKVESAQTQAERDTLELSIAQRKASVFRILGGACLLLLIALLESFWISEPQALKNVLLSTGSLLGLVVGAIIAVPITILLSPRVKRKTEMKLQMKEQIDE